MWSIFLCFDLWVLGLGKRDKGLGHYSDSIMMMMLKISSSFFSPDALQVQWYPLAFMGWVPNKYPVIDNRPL